MRIAHRAISTLAFWLVACGALAASTASAQDTPSEWSEAATTAAPAATAPAAATPAPSPPAPTPAPTPTATATPPTPTPVAPPAPTPQQAVPSIVEMKAAAYDAITAAQQADAAARQAQAAAASAQQQAAQARAAVEAASSGAPLPAPTTAETPPAPEPAPTAPPTPPTPPTPPAASEAAPAATSASDPVMQREVQRAIEKSEQAAAEARRTREELEAYKEAHRMRYARNGLTMSAGAFYAPQFFDVSAHVVSSKGLVGGIGYRLHPHFSIESSFNWVEGFAIDWTSYAPGSDVYWSGDLTMWSASIGGRFYVLTGKIQPYLGIGFGATGAKGTFRSSMGESDDFEAYGGQINFSGGLEIYVSESLALGADAAVFLPGGDIQGLNYSTLSGKLIYRF